MPGGLLKVRLAFCLVEPLSRKCSERRLREPHVPIVNGSLRQTCPRIFRLTKAAHVHRNAAVERCVESDPGGKFLDGSPG